MKRILSLIMQMAFAVGIFAQVTLTLHPAQWVHNIGDLHYGIFFEEINHAGDGGLYAELIRNRSFEDNLSAPEYWTVDRGEISISTNGLLNDVQSAALKWDASSGSTLTNYGFWGMKFEKGKDYELSFYAKSSSYTRRVTATLLNEQGRQIGQTEITVQRSSDWQKYTATITATDNAAKGSFALIAGDSGIMYLDVVSLFPPTYKGRQNGCRPDLAQMLADMKPAFMRFPGGCYIEGEFRNDSQNRFEWKKTVGPIENRPGHLNVNWNYRVSDGLGFHEMLQLSEDIGATPLFVVNIGLGHGWDQDINDLEEYVNEALDAIEYANGDASTTYGAMRIANGHPEPFNLKLIEIGNENYNFYSWNNNDQSLQYAERYKIFYDAIKAKYPYVTCIGNVEAWGTDNPSWRNNYPVDAVDEHYYRDPAWFVAAYNKYDNYDRKTMQKVYAGEYAVTSNFGSTGNLAAALGEAVYMQGMENNSDICVMSSYAPIFVNENDQKWMPDMIRFNSSESYGTPSYYVQKLMPNYVGKKTIKWTENGNVPTYDKSIGLSTWKTSAVFSNYKVTLEDGTVYQPKFNGSEGWQSQGGAWTENGNGNLVQSSTSMEGKMYVCPTLHTGDNYTIELDATKTGGDEGFLIAFNVRDEKNYCWWNLGGWGNTKHAVEVCNNGAKTTVAEKGGRLENNVIYHLKIVVSGQNVQCFMNDELTHSFTLNASKKVYVSSSIDYETGKLYLKLVNPSGEASNTIIKLTGYKVDGGKLVQMKSGSEKDENTNSNHYAVVPTEENVAFAGSQFTFDVPAYSFNILELNVQAGESNEGVYVEEGNYYITDVTSGLFLSRGADWGTRATFDKLGIPVSVTRNEKGTYTLRYLDSSTYFGKDGEPYTDKDTKFPIEWAFVLNGNGQVVLRNVSGDYLKAGDGNEAGATFTQDINQATPLTMASIAKRDAIVQGYSSILNDLTDCVSVNVTEIVFGEQNIGNSLEDCSVQFSKGTATRAGVTEVYEGYGKVEKSLKGLKPNSIYRLTIPAFIRSSSNDRMVQVAENGVQISNAYLYCGDNIARIMPWAMNRTSDKTPNSMEEAAACFTDGLYKNAIVGVSDNNGNLTFGICIPQYNKTQWLIWGDAMIELVERPQDYTSSIVNPSFEEGMNGWDSNMDLQGNNETSAMKHGSTYCEKWIKAPVHLADVYTKQTVENLPVGRYCLKASCHAENQSGTPSVVSGVYLFAGNEKVSVTNPQDYKLIVSVTDGTLPIGFMSQGTDANWITVDNFRLTWLGNDVDESTQIEAYAAILKKEVDKLKDLLTTKEILTTELKAEGNCVIAESENAVTVSELKDALDKVKACYEKLDAFRLDVKRHDPYTSYIFAYFPNNSDENLYLAHSLNGFDFTPLNNGQRVMSSDTVAIKKGIRDPHILRGVDGNTFYMVATDMRCAEGWDSNRGIVMYKSTDLVHWQHATVHFPTRFPEKWSRVTRVWAPEVIWNPDYVNADGSKGRYMVYFSLLTNDGTCKYDKVFYCHANDDFTDLIEEPIFLYDRGSATIDADIVYDDCDRLYHMIYKNEGSGGICHVMAKTLTAAPGEAPGSQWGKPSGTIQQTNEAVEGGGLFRLINSNQWVVMYDCYANGHYQFCTTDDWKTYTFKQNTYTSGAFTPRHGTVLPLTTTEARRLLAAFPTNGYNPVLPVHLGDANDDGIISIADANMVTNKFLDFETEGIVEENADVNKDGKVNISDANAIVNMYLGTE